MHITVYGRAIGRKVKEAISKNPALEGLLEQAIAATDWSYTVEERFYHVAEDKRVINPGGAVEIVHQESVVQMVQVAGIGSFFERLGRIVSAELEVLPTHITLYTHGNPHGIGLANQAEFEALVTGEISRADLKPISSEL